MTLTAKRLRDVELKLANGPDPRQADPRAPADDGRCFPDFLAQVSKSTVPRYEYAARTRLAQVYHSEYQGSAAVTKAALSGNSGQAGGYLVPPDFSLVLMDSLLEEAHFLPRCTTVPMRSEETFCPRLDVETVTSTAGYSSLASGIQFKWGSSQAPTETEPTFRQLDLVAWDLLGYTVLSNQWLWDAGPEASAYLYKQFAAAAAWQLEYALFQGTGANTQMPLGILNAAATIQVARGGGGTIAAQDVANMAADLLPYSWTRAVWACSPTALQKIVSLGAPYPFNQPAVGQDDGSIGWMMGRPVFVTEKLPAVGTYGDLVLFDPSLYVVGLRQDALVDASTLGPAFPTNRTDFRVWMRADGKPRLSNTVTLQDTSTKVSPYVALK